MKVKDLIKEDLKDAEVMSKALEGERKTTDKVNEAFSKLGLPKI